MEELLKLESDDTSASRDVASKIQSRLKGARDPLLLGELVDFYFQKYSKRARKVLTTLGEAHSQDFFDKLNECIWSHKILPVFKLLAHALNSQQTSWLYRIVDHPLFSSILQQLEESDDVMVLSMGVLVVAAILPLIPTYIGDSLQRLFRIFCDLATIRSTKRLGLTPQELVLHLEVSVYYLFLQLYALFPCNLFSFFKTYCFSSTRAQVHAFQEFVAPLFHQVQLHPGLVTDSCSFELSKGKWGAMEPSDIATHSIQFCMDALLNASYNPPPCKGGGVADDAKDSPQPPPASVLESLASPVLTSSRPQSLSLADTQDPTHTLSQPQPADAQGPANTAAAANPQHELTKLSSLSESLREPLDEAASFLKPEGLKTSEELSHFWSPSVSLGQIPTPGQSATASHRSSRTSVSHYSQPGHSQYSALPSPNSDSAVSSALHTPAPPLLPVFNYNNYSPTASVDGESLFARQAMTQSAVHTPSRLDESLTSAQLDPLSQSMRVESGASSPTKSLHKEHTSLRNKLGKFFSGFFRREEGEDVVEQAENSEGFIELFVSDSNLQQNRSGVSPRRQKASPKGQGAVEGSRDLSSKTREVESNQEMAKVGGHLTVSDGESSGKSDSPVNSHRRFGLEGVGELGDMDIDLSTLPPVSRPSRSDSESSQTSGPNFHFRASNDSPNAAGMGNFGSLDIGHSYQELGASATCEIPRASSSYPRRSVSRVLEGERRTHSSNSETEVSSRVLQVQEKLQRLVEHKEPRGEGSVSSSIVDSHTPVMEASGQHQAECLPRDSGMLHAAGPPTHGTQLAMRRVSVCSRRGIGLRFTSESSSGLSGTITGGSQSDPQEPTALVLSGHPSPLALLDQFVSCGEVLHRGNPHSIPLTEQEGVDWNHFGGCPHSEEFRIMQSQVTLLHSQLLFERHQCVQHAKRNRRLLSKARSAAHVTEELVSLRDQLHQQEALVQSLQEQLRKVTEASNTAKEQQLDKNESRQNARLKDENARLTEQLWRMQDRNKKLEEELKASNERFCALRDEHRHLQPQVLQAYQLQTEMAQLSKQHLRLKEVCHQQREQMVSLKNKAQEGWAWQAHCDALQREREGLLKRIHGLEQGLGACRGRLKELEEEGTRKQRKLNSLHEQLEEERERAGCKMKSLEEKYGSMKVIGQQMECHLMELKSRTTLSHSQRKKTHSSKHRRNPSTSSGSLASSPAPPTATPPITA